MEEYKVRAIKDVAALNKEESILYNIKRHPKMKEFSYVPPKYDDSFSLKNHIGALIGALLSNQRPWIQISKHGKEIEEIFCGYDANKILDTIDSEGYEYFINKIREIKCGNRNIASQMKNLKYNIELLKKFEKENGTVDKYYRKFTRKELIKNLSNPRSENKIKCMGVALLCEYLKGVGIDVAKPDIHIRRILGSERLGYSKKVNAGVWEVFDIMDLFHENTGESRAYIDVLLWHYCASGFGDVCTAQPDCESCLIDQCNKKLI